MYSGVGYLASVLDVFPCVTLFLCVHSSDDADGSSSEACECSKNDPAHTLWWWSRCLVCSEPVHGWRMSRSSGGAVECEVAMRTCVILCHLDKKIEVVVVVSIFHFKKQLSQCNYLRGRKIALTDVCIYS